MRERKRPKKVPKPLAEWPDFMAPGQLAECLAVDVKVVYAMIREGAPCSMAGKRNYRIFRDPFLIWLREQKKIAQADSLPYLAPLSAVKHRLAAFDGELAPSNSVCSEKIDLQA